MNGNDIILPKWARLEIFYHRLRIESSATSGEEAMHSIASILQAVEDEFSGVPYDPGEVGTDGRLYPPKEQYRRPKEERPGVRCYFQVGHKTLIADNGAIEISVRSPHGNEYVDTLELDKPGSDGRRVADYGANS